MVTKSRKSSAKFSFDAGNEEKNDEDKICDVKARVHQLHSFYVARHSFMNNI